MERVHLGAVAGFAGAATLCGVLAATVGLGAAGWVVGLGCGAVLAVLLDTALVRHGLPGLGPAGRITVTRAVLACGVAALTADALVGSTTVAALVALASVALVLDAVDGHVARRTTTETAFGARFDMEVDAFLIAVLSVYAAAASGWWVLAIGAMRYGYVAAGWLLSWLRRPTPPRYAAKVVAAIQGIVLTVAATSLLPNLLTRLVLAVALLLLLHSFGTDVRWQWRHRREPLPVVPAPPTEHAFARAAVPTIAAVIVLWAALAPPRLTDGFDAGDLLRIPIEGLALVGIALVLPHRPRRIAAVVLGLAAAALAVLRALGFGFQFVLDRSYHLLSDWSYLPKAVELVRDTEGTAPAVLALVAVVALIVGLAVVVPWAALRVTRVATEHRRRATEATVALAVAWALCAASGGVAAQVAAARSADLVVDTVDQVRADRRDRVSFQQELDADAFRDTPSDQLLSGLRGKDVLLVWVESYGRIALEDSAFAPDIVDVLDDGERWLKAAGYRTRSAYLTSPTFGAGSWLAHGTLQSGVWANSEQRYRQLLDSDRLSLTRAFDRAGWRTVFAVPANTRDWPEGAAYYGFDDLTDSRDVEYDGPKFGYASMPDQYTLEHFRRTELEPADRRPVMAEIDLISSHHPWAPLPKLVPWREVGDGSVFSGMPERGEEAVDGRQDPETAQRYYGKSIEYTWRTLISFLRTYPDPNRVLLIAGDHQPHSFVSGDDSGRDVPVTVIAQDPAVIERIADWEWQDGLYPRPDAPVWRMDEVRDRLFSAFGSPE
ncbi:CDP-alcohol phosphatidyltransferase family protein [Nocardioides speluncae]|uniref:CDP-alcohol phosphatidyltransferase family protein n=1 Tax=Nocardioides speluncae TaxID=2670337 RepID=UPI000D698BE4|nr:CDP-alcohol phosphatidyltransferase family protein [Nocardioides speluncae]